jgi:hypothetical protein
MEIFPTNLHSQILVIIASLQEEDSAFIHKANEAHFIRFVYVELNNKLES